MGAFPTEKIYRLILRTDENWSYSANNTRNSQQYVPFTSRIVEEVMDFEFEKYKCRLLLRLVETVEGFHWFRFTVRPDSILFDRRYKRKF
jgi:hypothetical protein